MPHADHVADNLIEPDSIELLEDPDQVIRSKSIQIRQFRSRPQIRRLSCLDYNSVSILIRSTQVQNDSKAIKMYPPAIKHRKYSRHMHGQWIANRDA